MDKALRNLADANALMGEELEELREKNNQLYRELTEVKYELSVKKLQLVMAQRRLERRKEKDASSS